MRERFFDVKCLPGGEILGLMADSCLILLKFCEEKFEVLHEVGFQRELYGAGLDCNELLYVPYLLVLEENNVFVVLEKKKSFDVSGANERILDTIRAFKCIRFSNNHNDGHKTSQNLKKIKFVENGSKSSKIDIFDSNRPRLSRFYQKDAQSSPESPFHKVLVDLEEFSQTQEMIHSSRILPSNTTQDDHSICQNHLMMSQTEEHSSKPYSDQNRSWSDFGYSEPNLEQSTRRSSPERLIACDFSKEFGVLRDLKVSINQMVNNDSEHIYKRLKEDVKLEVNNCGKEQHKVARDGFNASKNLKNGVESDPTGSGISSQKSSLLESRETGDGDGVFCQVERIEISHRTPPNYRADGDGSSGDFKGLGIVCGDSKALGNFGSHYLKRKSEKCENSQKIEKSHSSHSNDQTDDRGHGKDLAEQPEAQFTSNIHQKSHISKSQTQLLRMSLSQLDEYFLGQAQQLRLSIDSRDAKWHHNFKIQYFHFKPNTSQNEPKNEPNLDTLKNIKRIFVSKNEKMVYLLTKQTSLISCSTEEIEVQASLFDQKEGLFGVSEDLREKEKQRVKQICKRKGCDYLKIDKEKANRVLVRDWRTVIPESVYNVIELGEATEEADDSKKGYWVAFCSNTTQGFVLRGSEILKKIELAQSAQSEYKTKEGQNLGLCGLGKGRQQYGFRAKFLGDRLLPSSQELFYSNSRDVSSAKINPNLPDECNGGGDGRFLWVTGYKGVKQVKMTQIQVKEGAKRQMGKDKNLRKTSNVGGVGEKIELRDMVLEVNKDVLNLWSEAEDAKKRNFRIDQILEFPQKNLILGLTTDKESLKNTKPTQKFHILDTKTKEKCSYPFNSKSWLKRFKIEKMIKLQQGRSIIVSGRTSLPNSTPFATLKALILKRSKNQNAGKKFADILIKAQIELSGYQNFTVLAKGSQTHFWVGALSTIILMKYSKGVFSKIAVFSHICAGYIKDVVFMGKSLYLVEDCCAGMGGESRWRKDANELGEGVKAGRGGGSEEGFGDCVVLTRISFPEYRDDSCFTSG